MLAIEHTTAPDHPLKLAWVPACAGMTEVGGQRAPRYTGAMLLERPLATARN